jgi:thioredoxin 1
MASANVVEFTSDNWQTEVMSSQVPVVVDFWAPWCGPCRALAPAIDSVADKYSGQVKVGKLNIDDAQEIAAQFGVNSIPRVFVFKGGSAKQKIVGLVHESVIAKAIDEVLQER